MTVKVRPVMPIEVEIGDILVGAVRDLRVDAIANRLSDGMFVFTEENEDSTDELIVNSQLVLETREYIEDDRFCPCCGRGHIR